ncbi:nitroreductase HBN1-like protein 2 [Fusarium oxysporum f. sp. phaseoli]
MADKLSYLEAAHNRRSIYQLNRSSSISDDMIEEIIHQAIENVPSSFNSQSTQLVVLLKENHHKFWILGLEGLKAIVPPDSWPKAEKRITGFRDAYGSVLFYEDPKVISELQVNWQSAGLEAEGFGANLQHYNPLPDERAAEV